MIIEPASIEEVAAALAEASRHGQRVEIRGGGTRPRPSGATTPADLVLSMAKLDAVLAHRDGDLTATVQAGATLGAVHDTLGRRRQWIPLDPPWPDRSTIGGIVATNDSGPRRHRYGAPRDLIIGVDIVLADGTVAKAGGIVVKNVAGYDLSRLMTGSFGSLAVIVGATFKLYPLPAASYTTVVDLPGHAIADALGAAMAAISSSALTPTAVELQLPPGRLLVRFETTDAAARDQAMRVVSIAPTVGCTASVISGDEESQLWREHEARPWDRDGAVVKLTLLPTAIPSTLRLIEQTASGIECDVVGRAGVGVLLLRVAGEPRRQAAVVEVLRSHLPPGRGSAVVLRCSRELASLVDPWGPIGDALPLMRAVKRQFDPHGILNAGIAPWCRA